MRVRIHSYPTLQEAIDRVIGQNLRRVVFVEDYLQLVWSDATLTTYTLPTFRDVRGTRELTAESYRELMHKLENTMLCAARVTSAVELILEFSEAVLAVSLRDSDYEGPEAIMFSNNDGGCWVV